MEQSERREFASLMTNVLAYYGREVTPFLIDTYWAGLSSFDFDAVKRAMNVHAADPDRGQFAPRIADITRLLEGSTATQGMMAWTTVERALRTVGAYQSVVFDDPLIMAVIEDMGGWTPLCQGEAEELPFRAKDFERRYSAYRARREVPQYPSRLVGIIEADNRMAGFRIPPPVLIGDPDKARQVMESGRAGSVLRLTTAADAVLAMLEKKP